MVLAPPDDFGAFKVSVGARVKARRKALRRVIKEVAGEIGVSEDSPRAA